jgi:hypothetical protein
MLQSREKPLLFCDIDGVLSLFGFRLDECPIGNWHTVEGIAHFLSTPACEHLHDLQDAFEVVWCTGWEERANEHLPHLVGLGPFPHVSLERNAGRGTRAHWKLAAVEGHAGSRPLAWIDDAVNDACHDGAAGRATPTLLVATEPARGLGDTESAALRAWARELGASVA